jgi:hypothetical protein
MNPPFDEHARPKATACSWSDSGSTITRQLLLVNPDELRMIENLLAERGCDS